MQRRGEVIIKDACVLKRRFRIRALAVRAPSRPHSAAALGTTTADKAMCMGARMGVAGDDGRVELVECDNPQSCWVCVSECQPNVVACEACEAAACRTHAQSRDDMRDERERNEKWI